MTIPVVDGLPDQENFLVDGIQPFYTTVGDDGIVLQRDAQLPAAPFGDRGVRKQFNRKQVRWLNHVRHPFRIEPCNRWPDAVTQITDGMTTDDHIDDIGIVLEVDRDSREEARQVVETLGTES